MSNSGSGSPNPGLRCLRGGRLSAGLLKIKSVYKLPERMEIINALPRNPVGKILKRQLRMLLGEKPVGEAQ